MRTTLVNSAPLAPTVEALRTGRTDPKALLEELYHRIRVVEPHIQSLVSPVEWNRLTERVERLEREHPFPDTRPPLYGVPVGVKDIIHVNGFPTRAGSSIPPEALAGVEGPVVAALRAAGAIVLGKTVTTELAYRAPGPTRNPHAPDHTPGGSSSGSAAGVTAGLFPLSLGTQTAGSVIRPSSYCGVVGFKPSAGRVPMEGVLPISDTLDQLGFHTQDVNGLSAVCGVVCADWEDGFADDGQPILGVPAGPYLSQAEATTGTWFEGIVDRLNAEGFQTQRVRLVEDIERINQRCYQLIAGEAARHYDSIYEEHGERLRRETRDLIESGRALARETLATHREALTELDERIPASMRSHGIDLWIAPAAPGTAPAGLDGTGSAAMNTIWTALGFPAATIPVGSIDGLPMGLQCVGAPGHDERVVAWATELTEALRRR